MNDSEIATALRLQAMETAPDRMVLSPELIEILKGREDNTFLIHSKQFPELSESIGGFEGGELITISGWSGHGKTLFMQTLMNDFSMQGETVTAFSYEVTMRQFFHRFGSAIPIFATPLEMKGNDLLWLFNKIDESIFRYDSKYIFIDHLHYIISMSGNASKSDQIGEAMRELKKFAVSRNATIFLIAHTKKSKGEASDVLELGSVRDSSFIEQESDTVLYVWRARDNPIGGFVKIAKDRKNGTFNKTIKLIKQNIYLYEANNVRM